MKVLRGDWDCGECFAHNFAKRTHCFRCRSVKLDSEVTPQDHHASDSHSHDHGMTREYKMPKKMQRGDWFCPSKQCRAVNFASRTACFECETARPAQPDEWQCPDTGCAFMNKAFRKACLKCGMGNPGEIKLREGDWTCAECEYMNFARRNACQQCETPKPIH